MFETYFIRFNEKNIANHPFCRCTYFPFVIYVVHHTESYQLYLKTSCQSLGFGFVKSKRTISVVIVRDI